jgi:hypothetical protein
MEVIFHVSKWVQSGGEQLLPRILPTHQGPHSIQITGGTTEQIRGPLHPDNGATSEY